MSKGKRPTALEADTWPAPDTVEPKFTHAALWSISPTSIAWNEVVQSVIREGAWVLATFVRVDREPR
jgi:hypothetical protein